MGKNGLSRTATKESIDKRFFSVLSSGATKYSLLVFARVDVDHVGVTHHHGVPVTVAELGVTQSNVLDTGVRSNDGEAGAVRKSRRTT